MSDSDQILLTAGSILLVDWPSTDVPETLAGAGYAVFVKGGPEPDNYSRYGLHDGKVVGQRIDGPPTHADLVYSHRPVGELPAITAIARHVGATAVWAPIRAHKHGCS